MRTVNKAFLYGHLGNDPEVRKISNDRTLVRFSLATHRRIRVDDGFSEETDWHQVVAFDWLAQKAADRLRKGQPVAVVGTLRPQSWVDTQGIKRKRVDIIAENLCFGPLKMSQEDASVSSTGSPLPEEGDIPFEAV